MSPSGHKKRNWLSKRKRMRRLFYNSGLLVVTLIGMTMLQVSCKNDDLQIEGLDSGKISFRVAGVESRATSEDLSASENSVQDKNMLLELEGQSLNMSLVVEDNNNRIFTQKNIPSRSQAFDDTDNPVNKIFISSIVNENNGGGKPYFNNDEVEISNNKGVANRFWPQDKELSFFAYTCTKDINMTGLSYTRAGGDCSGTFKYILPTPQTTESPKDATNEADVIFAITPDCTMSGGSVDLVFHHALSAIVFKVGNMPENVYLKSITIENVYSEGTCSISTEDEQDLKFSWSGLTNRKSYTETLGADAVIGELMGTEESVFMMLPQIMNNENSKLTLNFSINGSDYTLSKSFKDIISSWEADKKYIFTIGLPDDISVEIEDQVEGLVKHSVEIQNTGMTTGYIRAAIVGYWVNPDGIVDGALSAADGTFVWGSKWNTYWKKGADGFYYHLLPVNAKEFTVYPLFEKFTLNEANKMNHTSQELEMNLIVQIIPVDEKSLWPELNQ